MLEFPWKSEEYLAKVIRSLRFVLNAWEVKEWKESSWENFNFKKEIFVEFKKKNIVLL